MMLSGVVSAMKTTLKNNKRDRPSAFKNLKENGDYSGKTELHFDKKASSEQLKAIRQKQIAENKKAFLIKAIIIGTLLILTIYFIGFAEF